MTSMEKRKLVTVIAETELEQQIVEELKTLGASGYTVSKTTGHGSRDVRSGALPGQNIRIEVIASDQLSEKIVTHISTRYFAHYAVICYVSEVEVLRAEKYV